MDATETTREEATEISDNNFDSLVDFDPPTIVKDKGKGKAREEGGWEIEDNDDEEEQDNAKHGRDITGTSTSTSASNRSNASRHTQALEEKLHPKHRIVHDGFEF
jgi:hypothetical protein